MENKPTYDELKQKVQELEEKLSKAEQMPRFASESGKYVEGILGTIREPLVVLDSELRVVNASAFFYRHFQTTPGQIVGKSFFRISNGQWEIPEIQLLLKELLVRNAQVNDYKVENKFESTGPKIMHINACRVEDGQDRTKHIILAIEDVTEQITVEREMRKSEAMLKEAAHLALLGHWELDLTTNTLFWSEEIYRMFELDPREFGATYEAFLDVVHPDDREYVDKAYQESVHDKTGYDIVHRLMLGDGRIKYVHERCKTEYDEKGDPIRSLGTVQDITNRIRLRDSFAGIIGREPRMKELFDSIRDLADVNVPVLIQGESGTGKELVAAAIHSEGQHRSSPFVPVNCSALPEGLLESELFGHVKGAFTGALRDKKGRFELAHGGTLFLDEVGDLPKVVQAKLLRVLQEGTFERVGGEKTISVDVRIISATNSDLKREVEKGNFRDDLFYRINVVPLYLPPLRERKGDTPILIEHFLEEAAKSGQISRGISKDAIAVMVDYPWPGNVRELQSAIRYALVKSKGKTIKPNHLPLEIQQYMSTPATRGPARKLRLDTVKAALIKTGGNKAKAAKILGVGRATLYRFLAEFPDAG